MSRLDLITVLTLKLMASAGFVLIVILAGLLFWPERLPVQ